MLESASYRSAGDDRRELRLSFHREKKKKIQEREFIIRFDVKENFAIYLSRNLFKETFKGVAHFFGHWLFSFITIESQSRLWHSINYHLEKQADGTISGLNLKIVTYSLGINLRKISPLLTFLARLFRGSEGLQFSFG